MNKLWLLRKWGKKNKAHIWIGYDTRCSMWSSGGLREENFEIVSDRGDHEICHMCEQVEKRDGF